ncbi:MAG: phosphatidate cytidylyltransferase [Pseudomonadota bacterium]
MSPEPGQLSSGEGGPAQARKSGKWTDVGPRVASGIVLGIVGAVICWLGGYWTASLVAVAAAAMAWEYRRVVFSAGVPSLPPLGTVSDIVFVGVAALIPLVAHASENFWIASAIALAGTVAFGLADGHRGRWTAPGFLLISAATAAFVYLRDQPQFGMETIFWLVGVVVASDVGGYFAGRLLGGPKLAPQLSPKKTWAGLGGSVTLAFAVGGLFSWATTGTYAEEVCTVSALAALVAVGGDLAESRLKRRFKVKDTSRLIPGHGGALDRLDGLMAATLVAATVTFARGKEVFIW